MKISPADLKAIRVSGAQHTADSSEWYTPPDYLEAARECMGSIDYDPASCAVAQWIVKAKTWSTLDATIGPDPWAGSVWLNPPTPPRPHWDRLIHEYLKGPTTRATYLAYSFEQLQQSQGWSAPMSMFPVLLPRERIRFWCTVQASIDRLKKLLTKRALKKAEISLLDLYRSKDPNELIPGDAPSHASAVVFLGQELHRIKQHWGRFGEIVVRA